MDRPLVSSEGHELLLRNFVARLLVREEVVGAILGPVRRAPEEQAGVCISHAVKEIHDAEDNRRTLLDMEDALEGADGVLKERALLDLVPRPLPVVD